MKNLLFPLFLLALGTSSCKKFLSTTPIDKVSSKQYYNDEQGLTQALAGVYDPLGSEAVYGNAYFTALGACTDEGFYARSTKTTGPEVYNFDPTDAIIDNFWSTLYVGVDRANQVIANINVPKMDETKRQQILGEALFLRAYYHFLLVSNFGDIPLKLTPTTSPNDVQIAKTPIREVYEQILKDMTEAEGKVSTSTAFGYSSRVSKTVVEGILARVCMQMAGYPLQMGVPKYTEALKWAQKVESSNEHALRTTFNQTITNSAYSQIFINEAQDVYDVKETMWEIDFKGNRTDAYTENGRLGNTNGITMTNVTFQADTGYSYGFIRGTARLYKLYNVKDLRRDWVLTPYTYNSAGARVKITTTTGYGRDCAKWRRSYEALTPKHKNYTPINFPVLRYSDVLLMIAEAENQISGATLTAYKAINQVRRRAYGVDINLPSVLADLPLSSNFQLAIEDERMRELCFEGTRRADLIRWGKFVSTMNSVGTEIATGGGNQAYGALGGKNVTSKHLLYPIPSKEIAINKALSQNDNW